MKRLQKAAVLVALVEALKSRDDWCGETSVQKACYFLQEMTKVPLGFGFVLHKYGPYSFDLADELTGLRADSILDLTLRDPRYGPCYAPGRLSSLIKAGFSKSISRFREHVDFVASGLAGKGVGELECLGTALYVSLEEKGNRTVKDRAAQLTGLKPHIPETAAQRAVKEVDEMFLEVGKRIGKVLPPRPGDPP